MRVVVDTSVFVNALLGRSGNASREVLRRCLLGDLRPVLGTTLFLEYEDVVHRARILQRTRLSPDEVEDLLDAFASVCTWTTVYYRWRPNLDDEADHHLLELAIASGAEVIVTRDLRHLRGGELRFPQVRIMGPGDLTQELGPWPP